MAIPTIDGHLPATLQWVNGGPFSSSNALWEEEYNLDFACGYGCGSDWCYTWYMACGLANDHGLVGYEGFCSVVATAIVIVTACTVLKAVHLCPTNGQRGYGYVDHDYLVVFGTLHCRRNENGL